MIDWRCVVFLALTQVGLVIGKGGAHVVYFQNRSGARIHIARESDTGMDRRVTLLGTPVRMQRGAVELSSVMP